MEMLSSRLLLLSLSALLALGACSDDNSTTDEVCDARSELRDSIDAVTSDISDGDFDAARDALPDVRDSYDNLVSKMDDAGAQKLASMTGAPMFALLSLSVVNAASETGGEARGFRVRVSDGFAVRA